jgi:endonuclease YncB( thermonuclease family)
VNRELVWQGWAVTYLGHEYDTEEDEARRERRGLWNGLFERPSEWRKAHSR